MNAIDPQDAAAHTLQAYLEAAVFRVAGTPEQRFRLKRVAIGWPENFEGLEYPTCSLTAPVVQEDAHSLTPTALEETLDRYCPGTVLWKTAEQAITFQCDFWCTDQVEQRAISAALGELFNPTEGRAGILLQGPTDYWDLPIRFTQMSRQRQNSSDSVQARSRRLTVMVLADVDVVQLRRGARLQPRFWVNGEPVVLESAGPA
jgi:hypothetical protein